LFGDGGGRSKQSPYNFDVSVTENKPYLIYTEVVL
jgi:hypothetical protein